MGVVWFGKVSGFIKEAVQTGRMVTISWGRIGSSILASGDPGFLRAEYCVICFC